MTRSTALSASGTSRQSELDLPSVAGLRIHSPSMSSVSTPSTDTDAASLASLSGFSATFSFEALRTPGSHLSLPSLPGSPTPQTDVASLTSGSAASEIIFTPRTGSLSPTPTIGSLRPHFPPGAPIPQSDVASFTTGSAASEIAFTPRTGFFSPTPTSGTRRATAAREEDIPIPSIEIGRGFTSTFEFRQTIPNTSQTSAPSIPHSVADRHSTPRSSSQQRDSSITGRLDNMRLGSSATPRSPSNRVTISPRRNAERDHSVSSARISPSSRSSRAVSAGLSRPAHQRLSSSRQREPPHDVHDEQPEEDQFHDPRFQSAFADATILMANLTDVLGGSTFHLDPDSTVRSLHQRASDLARFQCPPTRTVGFVGASGVGKSSLLNSLLDSRGLARTSNGGAACTCVATEYRYHAQDDFVIEVQHFTKEDLENQITEHLHAYRLFNLHGHELERDEMPKWELRATVARDAFNTMFGNGGFGDDILLRWPEGDVIIAMLDRAGEIQPHGTKRRETTASLGETSDRLMHLNSETGSSSFRQPAVWPFIKKISVFIRAHILSKGLVLVDLPGLRDLNSARQNITERYLLQCDEIFVVCDIGRATTDAGVKAVFNLAKQARLSNVGIVCTQSDVIDPDEARRDWKGAKAKGVVDRIQATEEAKQMLAPDRQRMKDLQQDALVDDLLQEEKEELAELLIRSGRQKLEVGRLEFELHRYLVMTRNKDITSKLRTMYNSQVSTGSVPVFCVSNVIYWNKRNEPRSKALPFLELSGIMDLRRHCIAIVSESQRQLVAAYVQNNIPALLSDIGLWVQSGAGSRNAEEKNAIRDVLNVLETRLRRELIGNTSQLSELARLLSDKFREQIYERRRTLRWSQAAANAGRMWSGWYSSTYSAFCRKYGEHSTNGAGGYHNWNEEAIVCMANDLAEPWTNFESSLGGILDRILMSIGEIMDWSIEYLGTELGSHTQTTDNLLDGMGSRQHLLISDVENLRFAFEDGLSTLRTDALSGIRSSIMGESMRESYNRCNAEYGAGSDRRRKDIINRTLSQEKLFKDLMNEFRRRFITLARTLQDDMRAAVATHLDVVTGTLDMIRSDNVALESEQDPEFRVRVEEGVRMAKAEMREIQGIICN
ncbi:hypothetical protein B0H63DRAFT_474992 [Podospora didyma]|uniref:G domain-containing protein n=1 Tax=Podospora didyma TaxID=330526 RepID=A0AAE0NGS7_9PEZI|nr:hypothetical protein B0H63DRAFT_474992 [Podospora didyma]